MKILNCKVLGIVSLLVLTSAQGAFAAAKFSIVGAGHRGLQSLPDPEIGYGGGAQVEFGGSQKFGVDVSAIYLVRRVSIASIGFSEKSLHAPVVARYYFGKSFGLGAGGFYDHSLETDGESDYGWTVSGKYQAGNKIFIDARYNRSLKDAGRANDGEILLLVGFSFGK